MDTAIVYLLFIGGFTLYIWSLKGAFGSKGKSKGRPPSHDLQEQNEAPWPQNPPQAAPPYQQPNRPPPGYGPPPNR